MSKGRLSKPRLARAHDVMAGYVDRGEIPGMVTLISRHGETHVEAFGAAQQGTIFRVSSMTKPIAAAAAMMLVEDCKLRLDDPVDALLPELANRKVLKRLDGPLDDTVPAQRPITLRDLLTFRNGFGQMLVDPNAYPIMRAANELQIGMGPPAPATMPDVDEWMRRLGTLPLMYQPGERWLYNTGAEILGVLIARASGQPFETFLRERIFEPLGMKDTSFSVPAAKVDRLAPSYRVNFQTGALELYDAAAGGQWSKPPAFPSGGAGLCSTIADYVAFANLLLYQGKHGSTRLLSRASVETMTTDQLTDTQKSVSGFGPGFFDSMGWGFGMSVVTKHDDMAANIGTYGWDGGLGTSWRNDPKEELITILLSQRMWTSPRVPNVSRDWATLAYAAIED
jgi:CubicO group peptidase (beta-lactamase class C family)